MDIECPYCEHEQDICHDDGFGYGENELHEMECENCDKNFTFTTSIIFLYEGYKADCLNGGAHKLKPTKTIPRYMTRMYCSDCDYERPLTDADRKEHNIPTYEEATNGNII